jgi:hypothetical protein
LADYAVSEALTPPGVRADRAARPYRNGRGTFDVTSPADGGTTPLIEIRSSQDLDAEYSRRYSTPSSDIDFM